MSQVVLPPRVRLATSIALAEIAIDTCDKAVLASDWSAAVAALEDLVSRASRALAAAGRLYASEATDDGR